MAEKVIKVFVAPPSNMSQAMFKVEKALVGYAPGRYISTVVVPQEADVEFLHVIGWTGMEEKLAEIKAAGRKYAIIQYCLRTAEGAATCDKWIDIWRGAEVVWSYYDLKALAAEDGVDFTGVNFYHSPLGVESDTFRMDHDTPKKYFIGTSGYVAETEGVFEANEAVHTQDASNTVRQFHLGPELEFPHKERVYHRTGLSELEVSQMWSRCYFVAGLRRGEGFELPVVEGLLSGARPICFDKPHYRQWFEGFAEFIPEGTFEEVRDALISLFKQGARPVTPEERDQAVALFDWSTIVTGLFHTMLLRNRQAVSTVVDAPTPRKGKPTVLWVGDAGVSTGFARATHYICDELAEEYNVHVLGLNYFGDPRPKDEKFTIWPPRTLYRDTWNDPSGISRLQELVDRVRPDVIVVQNDPWNMPRYIKACGNIPMVAAVAVDGLNCPGRLVNGVKAAIFWTEFGMEEARKGGYQGLACVIPLGVDTSIYYPEPMQMSREKLFKTFSEGSVERARDAYIVGCVNRNQPRKRLDLTVSMFAEWVKNYDAPNAMLFFHIAPTAEDAYDISGLAHYYGIANRIILYEPEAGDGAPEEELRSIYNSFDVGFTTTQGEGMWLPGLEMMACGKSFIAPDWSALGDWAKGACTLVPCSEIAVTLNRIGVIGGVIDRAQTINALQQMYADQPLRNDLNAAAYSRATEERFNWKHIGEGYLSVLDQVRVVRNGVAG